jgi:hypothetical protein
MVFFIIAAALQGTEEADIERHVKSSLTHGGRAIAEDSAINIDKKKFKVGTLDQLMELNEALAKVDQTLDSTVKKLEKQAREMTGRELMIELSPGKQVVIEQYLKEFKWEDNRFSRARSLVEIAGLISDKMKSIDNDIKKQ